MVTSALVGFLKETVVKVFNDRGQHLENQVLKKSWPHP